MLERYVHCHQWTGLAVATTVVLATGAPCQAQSSGVSVGLQGGFDAMFGDDSGPAGELVAGYRWDSGFELLAGTGLKFRFSFGADPDHDGSTEPDDITFGPLEVDHVHYFGEMRFWPWTSSDDADFPAGFFGLRAGSASKRGGGWNAHGAAVGATGGAEFEWTETLGVSTSLVLDYVGIGRDANLPSHSFHSLRAGLRVGLRALFGSG